MKRTVLALIICMLAISISIAQSDILPARESSIKLTPVFHATTVLEWNGKTIYIDPYNGAEAFKDFADADVILITHAHGDHLNKETLKGLNITKTQFIVPASVAKEMKDIPVGHLSILPNGEMLETNGFTVEAVPMYNLPEDETSRHKKGWGNGYVLTLGGQRLYFSGDTEDIPEMRELKDIDYAFVCMNLPYTMDVDAAADAVLEMKPKHVYPYHYRGGGGVFSDIEKFKSLVNKGDEKIEVRLREWYPK